MDNLTHSLIGVTLSRAGFNRLTPGAGWLMLAAANFPDVDIVSGLKDATTYLECHRGWTHALAWSPVVALFPLPFWWLALRRSRPGVKSAILAYLSCLVGVWSHSLMDWMNVYGIRLWLPFRETWERADVVNIVDLWLWVILGLGIAAPMLGGLVSSEIGAKRGTGRPSAWAALMVVAIYIAFRFTLHADALAVLESRMHLGRNAARVAAFPTAVNPWSWTGIAEGTEFYRVYPLNLMREFDPDQGRTVYKANPEAAPLLDAARQTRSARAFLAFAQFPLWQATPAPDLEGGTLVRLTDLRFGMPEDHRFEVEVLLDSSRRVVREAFSFGPLRPK